MTRALFLMDSYLKECDSIVLSVENGRHAILDQTIFHPKGGGQPWDTGKFIKGNEIFNVVAVVNYKGAIVHEVDRAGLKEGDGVKCVLNWERRYKLMRSHTAAHVFGSLLYTGAGALITGNQLEEDKIRFDFNLEKFDRTIIEEYIEKANELFKKDIEVKWYELPREEALKIPGVVKMAGAFPPDLPTLRIVEIVGIDKQADGGTHVKNLREVGQLRLIKAENKGKNNRRVYLKLI
ncbi:MAG: alanyl-tRNA editing protein [Methanocellales archaeon]